ncbi:F-box/FBD/LRR-repeat protein At1g13570 isoform X2 [Amborella trichopoda]|uniref:F-box/FBD/LRR-repeat protein At1g13570 isoform X2 n=1 Tax=Amborella trichopoda TaxID=13333 RepID=UPI0005D395AA|nr:F-box/FBD/LRR-repeat protein At1g13570 isoform X2 [Amborella trichopoda]|eukprot:XP_011627024.1 F-box/FBD/LRR-repeat protein At1g13570 isoform X2 [Amborella trichopoda]
MDLLPNNPEFLSHFTIENSGEASTNQDTALQSSTNTIANSYIYAIENSGLDHFSELPKAVIESILSLLPIRDAIQVSLLSRKWRHAWASIPCLNIDNYSLEHVSKVYHGDPRTFTRFLRLMKRFFLFRCEPVQRCKIEVDLQQWGFLLDLWINYFKERGLPELVLGHFGGSFYGGLYQVPCSVFDCGSLKLLKITNCRLELPSSFNGFPHIETVEFKNCDLADNLLQGIASNSPRLETLTLYYSKLGSLFTFNAFKGVKALEFVCCRIDDNKMSGMLLNSALLEYLSMDFVGDHSDREPCHPNLQSFYFKDDHGVFTFHFKKTPCLADASTTLNNLVDLGNGIEFNILKGNLVGQKTLSLGSLVIRVVLDDLPERLLGAFHNLSKLCLGVLPIDVRDCDVTSILLKNSPYMKDLSIVHDMYMDTEDYPEDDYWDTQGPFNCLMHHLTTIHISLSWVKGTHDMKFVKFLLMNAHVLRKMTIKFGKSRSFQKKKECIKKDLALVKLVSSHVDLIFS